MPVSSDFFAQEAFVRFLDIYSQTLRKFIVFCGAGASIEAGLPDWDGLIAGIENELLQPVHNAMGEALLRSKIEHFRQIDDPWEKIEFASDFLGENYTSTIEHILKPKNDKIPLFYSEIWRLRVSGLLTMNLDGLAQTGFSKDKAIAAVVHTGKEAFQARNLFTSKEPTIVELHGNINRPQSWILRRSDIDSLFNSEAYTNFLRGVFSENLILIYGMSEGDASITAQLRYLRSIKAASGEYFALKRWPPTVADRNNSVELGVSYIYISEDMSWSDGLRKFVNEVKNFKAEEPKADIVKSNLSTDDSDLPSTLQMMQMAPDEVRLLLAKASGRIAEPELSSSSFEGFKKEYDLVINHASRVLPGTLNDKWLGYQLIREQGSGNFGRVFHARSTTWTDVAIKIAHDSVRDNSVMLNSFRRGVQAMRLLTKDKVHGVVGIIDASELPPSIIMNFVDGINLEVALERELISDIPDILRIHLEVCRIIFRCHTHKPAVLHRDLRPQNVMIDGEYWDNISESQVKVLDFDLSWFEGATGQDYYMAATNSLGYLAPEQIRLRRIVREVLWWTSTVFQCFYFICLVSNTHKRRRPRKLIGQIA